MLGVVCVTFKDGALRGEQSLKAVDVRWRGIRISTDAMVLNRHADVRCEVKRCAVLNIR